MRQNAKRKIIHNMIALLELHPFENITIKCYAYSDINRTTFYDYFVDKYDLLATIQYTIFGNIKTNEKSI